MIADARHPWARRPDFPRYVDVVARLYASRGDGSVWLAGRALSSPGRAAIAELLAAADQGLVPADYDASTLDGLARGLPHASWNAMALARFDLLLTVDIMRYLDDLRSGRVRQGPFGQSRAPPANASFVPLPAASTVRPGEPYAGARSLRGRLIELGDLAADASFGLSSL